MDNTLKMINDSFFDEKSKRIFANRLLFAFTSDYGYIKNLQDTNFFQKENKYILWGRGYWGKEIITCYPDVNWIGICDNNVLYKGKSDGIDLIMPDQLLNQYIDSTIVIATRKYWREVLEQLKKIGVDEKRILNLGRVQEELANCIYFDLEFLKKEQDEVFVDGGCFDVTTSKSFIRWSGGNYKKIYAFEPDLKSIDRCKKIIKDECINNIEIYNYALSDKDGYISFEGNGSEVSKESSKGNSIVETRRLQDIVKEKVIFIKLDIEGMEIDALKGMEIIIKNDKPKIAVSVYHKKEDIWKIAKYILNLNPSYRLYLRHYSIGSIDTVLYAINND